MLIFLPLFLSLHFHILFAGQCNLGPLISFYDCVYYCLNKYGQDPQTQRIYYNKEKGICQKQVDCGQDGIHRIYQNRCLADFESTQIGDVYVAIPEDFSVITKIYVHGNARALSEEKQCYPGWKSSNKRIQISKQVYQIYKCDIKIGQDPVNYPDNHGQYFFWRLDPLIQVNAVDISTEKQSLLDWFSAMLALSQVCIFISIFYHHICKGRKSKKLP